MITKIPGLSQAIFAITLTVLASSAHATVLFFDDFDSGADPAWGNQQGNWRDTGGVYDATNPTNNPGTYTDVTSLTTLTDFAVDVDINDLNDGGVWLRSDFNGGAVNGVLLVTGGFGGSFDGVYWHVATNGSFSGVLSQSSFSGLQGSDAHLRIEVIGDTYSAFLNGASTPLTTLTTSTYSAGSTGLYDYSPTNGSSSPAGQTFDNFMVTDLTPVPAPPALVLFAFGLAGLLFGRQRGR